MGKDIQIVADIIFNDDCLLYLCTPDMGVKLQKARASPCLRSAARKREEGSEGSRSAQALMAIG